MQNRNQVTVHCIPYVTKCLYKVTLKEKKNIYSIFIPNDAAGFKVIDVGAWIR